MQTKLLLAGLAAALTLSSCNGNKTNNTEETTDSVAVSEIVSAAADSITTALADNLSANSAKDIQTTLNKLQTKYQELVQSGKVEEAQVYASKVQAFVNEHAEEIKTVANGDATVSSLINAIVNLPTTAEKTANEAAAAVKSDAEAIATSSANTVKTAVQNKANETASNIQEKTNKAVSDAQAKVNKDIENANKKANDAVNNATNKALKGIGL